MRSNFTMAISKKKANVKKRVAATKVLPKRAKRAPLKKAPIKAAPIGVVTHYYSNIGVAVVNVKNPFREGDRLKIAGNTTDFRQMAKSIQFNRKPLKLAPRGREVGLKVNSRVRKGDQVLKFL